MNTNHRANVNSMYSNDLLLLARSLDRQTEMEGLIKRLYAQLDETRVLLRSALYELAAEQQAPGRSKEAFVTAWYRRRGVRL
jgi:hypothetical protein